jgi:hypothetical protein
MQNENSRLKYENKELKYRIRTMELNSDVTPPSSTSDGYVHFDGDGHQNKRYRFGSAKEVK